MGRIEIVDHSADAPGTSGRVRGDTFVLPGRGYSIDQPLGAFADRVAGTEP